jgi:formate hydrogenlyase subunit 4
MIHEAMILEYSGKRLALIEWASANKLLFFVVTGVNIFFPWGIAQTTTVSGIFTALVVVIIKVAFVLFAIGFLESSIAKYRFFRLADILMTGFIFCVISLIMSVL